MGIFGSGGRERSHKSENCKELKYNQNISLVGSVVIQLGDTLSHHFKGGQVMFTAYPVVAFLCLAFEGRERPAPSSARDLF